MTRIDQDWLTPGGLIVLTWFPKYSHARSTLHNTYMDMYKYNLYIIYYMGEPCIIHIWIHISMICTLYIIRVNPTTSTGSPSPGILKPLKRPSITAEWLTLKGSCNPRRDGCNLEIKSWYICKKSTQNRLIVNNFMRLNLNFWCNNPFWPSHAQ